MKLRNYRWFPSLENGGCSRSMTLGMKRRVWPWVPAAIPHMGHIQIAYVDPELSIHVN